MAVKVSNNATTKLAGSIAIDSTTVAVEDASAFPALSAGEWFPATIVDSSKNMEIVKVTARSGATFTIERAQEGTVARAFTAGARIDLRVTSAALAAMVETAVDTATSDLTTALNDRYTKSDVDTLLEPLGTNAERNLTISSSSPNSGDGADGDVWYVV